MYDLPMAGTTLLITFTVLNVMRPTLGVLVAWFCGVPAAQSLDSQPQQQHISPRDAFAAELCALATRAAMVALTLSALAPLCITLCAAEEADCTPSSASLGLLSAADCGDGRDEPTQHRLEPAFAPMKAISLASWWSCHQPDGCARELLSPWPLVNVPVRLQAYFFWYAPH